MKTALLAFVGAGALILAAGAAQAEDAKPNAAGDLIVAVRATGVLPTTSDAILTAAGAKSGLHVDVANDYKPTLGFTYFLTDKIAVEAILGTTQHQINAQGPGTNVEVHKTWVLPPVVALQYHPLPNAAIRPYVGAGLNYMLFYGGKDQNGFKVDLKDGLGYALQAGANVPLQGNWVLNADVKKVFFKTDASVNGGALKSSVHLDPWVVSIGVARRF